jgi:molybdopterin-guanine dinucleotide biosynthesis protein A
VSQSCAADVSAAILAGGEGVRVEGRDKGLMLLSGRPLIDWVCTSLRGQVGRILICANRNASKYAAYGTVVPDAAPGFRGPLAGIASALTACPTPWLVTVPVDNPHPPAVLCQRLHAAAVAAGVPAAVLHDGEHREPLFAIYRREAAVSAREALDRDSPVWRWQDELGAVDVDFSDCVAELVNLNTAGDFRRMEQQRRG